MENKKTYIIGCEGTALNIIDQINDARKNHGSDFTLEGILIDSHPTGSLIGSVPVAGSLKDIPALLASGESRFIFALYKPGKKKEGNGLLKGPCNPEDRFVNFIHPLAYVSPGTVLGTGNIVMSNASVMSGVKAGNFNIINAGVTIEHETEIGDSCFFAAGAVVGSKVKIGNYCFIGLNSTIRENVELGENVFVGMSSAVLNSFNNCRIAGIPAKKI